ncbi:MAG: helix-turn-helix domain-containing protein [Acidimicrobiales bacterium]
MSMKTWEKKILNAPGAPERVVEIEEELRLAAGLTSLREQAGLSQRQLAQRIGVSQPRVVAIEQSRNVTIDVLDQYVRALGGELEVTVLKGRRKIPLMRAARTRGTAAAHRETPPRGSATAVTQSQRSPQRPSRAATTSTLKRSTEKLAAAKGSKR